MSQPDIWEQVFVAVGDHVLITGLDGVRVSGKILALDPVKHVVTLEAPDGPREIRMLSREDNLLIPEPEADLPPPAPTFPKAEDET